MSKATSLKGMPGHGVRPMFARLWASALPMGVRLRCACPGLGPYDQAAASWQPPIRLHACDTQAAVPTSCTRGLLWARAAVAASGNPHKLQAPGVGPYNFNIDI